MPAPQRARSRDPVRTGALRYLNQGRNRMGIRVASAPVSWGIMENVPVPPEYPYSRVLDEIAQAGYTGTELGPYGFLPVEPSLLRRELDLRGLKLCSAFVAIPLGDSGQHESGLAQVKQAAQLINQAGAR